MLYTIRERNITTFPRINYPTILQRNFKFDLPKSV